MTYGTQRNLEKYEIIPYCFLLFLIVSHVSLLFPTFPYCPYRSLPTILLLFLLSLLPLLFRSVPYIPYCSPLSPIVPTVPYCFLLSPNVSYYPPLFPAIPHCFLLSPIVSYTVPLLHPTVPYSSFFFVVPFFVYVIQTIPFWPNKTPAKNLKIKTDESPIESVSFNFESNVNLLLRMDNGVSEKK